MDKSLSRVLRCPFCSGALAVSDDALLTGDLAYGILTCDCGRYPVVAGIPILKKGDVNSTTSFDDVIALIESKRHREALLAVLTPRPPSALELAPPWIRALPSFRGMARIKSLFGKSRLRGWRKETEDFLTRPLGKNTTAEFLDIYYRRSGAFSDVHRMKYYEYFALRLSQPRYLTTLSLAKALSRPGDAVLDLACGVGHITRHLQRWSGEQLVVGIDQDFLLVYLASHSFAPGARYVCADVDISIPFADGSYSLSVCSDAFYLFLQQASCMRELKRVTREDGVLLLSSIRNGLVKWNSANIFPTLTPEGYETLAAGTPYRMVGNGAIMDRYERREGPALASQTALSNLYNDQWLSLVVSHRAEVFRDYPVFKEWPHIEESRLGLNPAYKEEGLDASGNFLLRRVFPSAFYEWQNASEDGHYMPELASVSSKAMADLARGDRTVEINELISKGIVLGFPDNHVSAETVLK